MRYLAFIILLGVSGCGTIRGINQTVAIDSDPRGLSVWQDGEKAPLGRTPTFTRIKRASTLKLDLRQESVTVATIEIPCSYRWSMAATNLAASFTSGGILLVPSLLAIDWYTGAAYECPDKIDSKIAPSPSLRMVDVPYCRRIMVVPPSHISKHEGLKVVSRWKQENADRLTGCDEFLDQKSTTEVLSLINFKYGEIFDVTKFPPVGLREMGFGSQATHVVALELVKKDEHTSEVKFSTIEFINPSRPADGLNFVNSSADFVPPESLFGKIQKNIEIDFDLLLPNSWTIESLSKATITELVHLRNNRRIVQLEESKSLLPKFLSTTAYTSVSHPYGHPDWSLALDLYPRFGFIWLDYRIQAEIDSTDSVSERMRIQLLSLEYLIGFSYYTPLFAWSYALGPGVLSGRTIVDSEQPKYRAIRTFGFSSTLTKFINESLFLQTGFEYSKPVDNIPGRYHDFSPRTMSYFGRLGFYLPAAHESKWHIN